MVKGHFTCCRVHEHGLVSFLSSLTGQSFFSCGFLFVCVLVLLVLYISVCWWRTAPNMIFRVSMAFKHLLTYHHMPYIVADDDYPCRASFNKLGCSICENIANQTLDVLVADQLQPPSDLLTVFQGREQR